jgi:hypothetical protein
MTHDLEVDAGGLRECAAAVADTGGRVGAGVAGAPVTVPAPHWETTEATSLAADATRQRLADLGLEIAAMARQIIATAIDYEGADERAATRLRDAR